MGERQGLRQRGMYSDFQRGVRRARERSKVLGTFAPAPSDVLQAYCSYM